VKGTFCRRIHPCSTSNSPRSTRDALLETRELTPVTCMSSEFGRTVTVVLKVAVSTRRTVVTRTTVTFVYAYNISVYNDRYMHHQHSSGLAGLCNATVLARCTVSGKRCHSTLAPKMPNSITLSSSRAGRRRARELASVMEYGLNRSATRFDMSR